MNQKERVEYFQSLYREVSEENEMLSKFIERLDSIQEHHDELMNYYQGEWIDDYNNYQVDEPFEILNQDSIFEALIDQNQLLLKLNKVIANQLYQEEEL